MAVHLFAAPRYARLRGKIARPLIDNENLPDPPERPQGKGEKGGGKAGRVDESVDESE